MQLDQDSTAHFRAVIDTLRLRLSSLDEAIRVDEQRLKANREAAAEMRRHVEWLELQASGGKPVTAAVDPASLTGSVVISAVAPYLIGLPIGEACVAVLRKLGRPASNSEITATLKSDGYVINSSNPVNNVGSCLNNRVNTKKDVIRDGRFWKLAERREGSQPAEASAQEHEVHEVNGFSSH